MHTRQACTLGWCPCVRSPTLTPGTVYSLFLAVVVCRLFVGHTTRRPRSPFASRVCSFALVFSCLFRWVCGSVGYARFCVAACPSFWAQRFVVRLVSRLNMFLAICFFWTPSRLWALPFDSSWSFHGMFVFRVTDRRLLQCSIWNTCPSDRPNSFLFPYRCLWTDIRRTRRIF